jgi:hypothetical protein
MYSILLNAKTYFTEPWLISAYVSISAKDILREVSEEKYASSEQTNETAISGQSLNQ